MEDRIVRKEKDFNEWIEIYCKKGWNFDVVKNGGKIIFIISIYFIYICKVIKCL